MNIRVMNRFTRHHLKEDYSTGITRNPTLLAFGFDFFTAFFNKQKLRIGDKNAQTIVVRNSKALKQYNLAALRNKKRFVKIYDDYDSHGVYGEQRK